MIREGRRVKPAYQVTAGVVCKGDRVLITRRPPGTHMAGLWEFPGGKQESSETLEACLERELLEELGIRVQLLQHLLTVQHDYPEKRIYLHAFACRLLGGEPRSLQGQELAWVRPQDLEQFPFPPPDQEIVRFVAKWMPRSTDAEMGFRPAP